MNKPFARAVQKQRRHFGVAERCFYLRPVEHILCGFCYERVPHVGAYIRRYAYPLYDPIGLFHLAFGDRLPIPEGFMRREEGRARPSDEAAEFVTRIAPYESETAEWGQVPAFLALLESQSPLDAPPMVRAHAFTLAALGRYSEAEAELQRFMTRSDLVDSPHFVNGVPELRAAISNGGDCARECLLRWEDEAKTRWHRKLRAPRM